MAEEAEFGGEEDTEPRIIDSWPPEDINPHAFHKYHVVIEYPPIGDTKTVKLCRCWQSKKFPICDNTHRQLKLFGDNVGPFIAKLQPIPAAPLTEKVGVFSNLPRRAAVPGALFLGAAFAVGVWNGRPVPAPGTGLPQPNVA
jgi:CDGSH-type Zn-finger protein